MPKSLLFIPDISGFTNFIQSTEAEHSQHVIAELLEILIASNTLNLQLAEIEGDALFFYKKDSIPSQEQLLAQVETMFTAFYNHLKMLEKNRICPCSACAMAPQLELKIIAHCGVLQSLNVQGKKKPFGQAVIEVHRLLKNNIDSHNYLLVSYQLAIELKMPLNYKSRLFSFVHGEEHYDHKEIKFVYTKIDKALLQILSYETPKEVVFERGPNFIHDITVNTGASLILEFITNYKYRGNWVNGVDQFVYDEVEVTRLGTEHMCVINGKHFNFTTVTKKKQDNQLIYGELAENIPIMTQFYQFYIIEGMSSTSCKVTTELYWIVTSPINRLIFNLFAKNKIKTNVINSLSNLKDFAEQNSNK